MFYSHTRCCGVQTLEVEAAMRSLQAEDQREHRVLVLGAGESGKSTILKQLKMIFKVIEIESQKQCGMALMCGLLCR